MAEQSRTLRFAYQHKVRCMCNPLNCSPDGCLAAQPLMYSHAILAWWGQSVYLSLADHDEYLALANPEKAANVQDLMAKCFDDLAQVYSLSRRAHEKASMVAFIGSGVIVKVCRFSPYNMVQAQVFVQGSARSLQQYLSLLNSIHRNCGAAQRPGPC